MAKRLIKVMQYRKACLALIIILASAWLKTKRKELSYYVSLQEEDLRVHK